MVSRDTNDLNVSSIDVIIPLQKIKNPKKYKTIKIIT